MTMVLLPSESLDDLVATGNGACPGCGGSLRRWGQARWRVVRGLGEEWGFRPPRVRCARCRVTQVVLPADVLIRRRDAVVVVGRAWRSSVGGAGARRVAAVLGLPMETVRGWLRRLRAVVQVRDGSGVAGTCDPLRAALADWEAEAGGAGWRDEEDIWRFVAHRTQGRLLCNTS